MAEDLKSELAKSSESKFSNWWQTMPGVLTAIAGIITGIAGLVATLHQAGMLPTPKPSSEPPTAVTSSPSNPKVESPTSPTPSAMDSPPSANPQSIALADGMEATLQTSAEGNAVYKVLSARLEPHNADDRSLKLILRCTNNGRYPMNFWNQSFRLLIDGVVRSPSNDLNLTVEPQSAKEGEIIFTVPAAARTALLKIGDPSKETTQIPFDFSTAKP